MRLATAALCAALLAGCSLLPRPDHTAPRVIEPVLPATEAVTDAEDAVGVRLAELSAREHLQFQLIHRKADGQLVRDGEWSWSTTPDRYLADALTAAVAADPTVRVLRSPDAIELRLTITAFEFAHTEGAERAVVTTLVEVTDPAGNSKIEQRSVAIDVSDDQRAIAMGTALSELSTQILVYARGG